MSRTQIFALSLNLKLNVGFLFSAAGNSHTVKKITYTREFLLQLRHHPVSLQKPEGLPDLVCIPRRLNLYRPPRFIPQNCFDNAVLQDRWSRVDDDIWSWS